MHTGSRCSRVSSSQVPDPAAPRFSAGWLHPPPGLLQWNKVYAPFYFGGEWGGEEGISHKLFSHNQALKKQQSQKRMRRNKQHTFFGTQTPRQKQAGRPSPTPRLYDSLQPLITWSPCLSHTLTYHPAGWGCGNRQVTLQQHPGSISLALKPTKT